MRHLTMLMLALLLGCDRRGSETQSRQKTSIVSLAEASISEVVPTADGGAYVVTLDSGLWYMRGTEAVRVVFKEVDGRQSREQPPTGLLDEVVPTVNGGAYYYAEMGKTIWYLQEAKASRVAEALRITKQGQVTRPRDGYFSLYIAELKRRRAIDKYEEYQQEPEQEEREY